MPFADRDHLFEADIGTLQRAMSAGQTTAQALVANARARVAAYDRRGAALNAVVSLDPTAEVQAEALHRERATQGPRGPLHGIPVLVKDNIDVAGLPTSAGTLALASWRRYEDAQVVRRLREAGAVILGKTAMHELAAGITGASSRTGPTRNAYDPARVAGGSSSGSAVAVAASYVPLAIGSDTAGSIRIPASFGAAVGLRGTAGRVPVEGIVPLSTTQDVAGPLARSVRDVAIGMDALLGLTGTDPGSMTAALATEPPRGVRIGVLRDWIGVAAEEAEVTAVVEEALAGMEGAGFTLVNLLDPGLDDAVDRSNVIALEFKFALSAYLRRHGAPVTSLADVLSGSTHHAELDAVFRLREAPTDPQAPAYRRALAAREALRRRVLGLFEEHRLDALVHPTVRRPPCLVGEAQLGPNGLLGPCTGLPAISVPGGFTARGLPVGLDLLGRPHEDARLLALAARWEAVAPARRAPWTTPRLGSSPHLRYRVSLAVGEGEAPTVVELLFDPGSGLLTWAIDGAPPTLPINALALHREGSDGIGPVLATLLGEPGPVFGGSLRLDARTRTSLLGNALHLRAYSTLHPQGAGWGKIVSCGA